MPSTIGQSNIDQNRQYVLTVKANGGKVQVQKEADRGVWVTGFETSEDGCYPLQLGMGVVQVVPTGGALWSIS